MSRELFVVAAATMLGALRVAKAMRAEWGRSSHSGLSFLEDWKLY